MDNDRGSGPYKNTGDGPNNDSREIRRSGTTESAAAENNTAENGATKNGAAEVNAAEVNAERKNPDAGGAGKPGDEVGYASAKEAAKGGILGAFIGLAIIIPGVSGSAVAIIFKLYDRLLYALGNLFRQFKACLLFLLPIILGVIVGLAVGFFGVKLLLNAMLFAVVALFAGLMLGAFPAISDEVKGQKHSAFRIVLFALGVLVPVALSLISIYAGGGEADVAAPEAYEYVIYLLLGFAVAITQLVPGLSATALLMATGHYVPLINSVSIEFWQLHPQIFAVYACLIAGFVAGLLCFAKLLTVLLKNYRAATFHAVAGLALGSVVTMFLNPEMLSEYSAWAAGERFGPDLALGSLLFVAGIAAAYTFVRMQRKNNVK